MVFRQYSGSIQRVFRQYLDCLQAVFTQHTAIIQAVSRKYAGRLTEECRKYTVNIQIVLRKYSDHCHSLQKQLSSSPQIAMMVFWRYVLSIMCTEGNVCTLWYVACLFYSIPKQYQGLRHQSMLLSVSTLVIVDQLMTCFSFCVWSSISTPLEE